MVEIIVDQLSSACATIMPTTSRPGTTGWPMCCGKKLFFKSKKRVQMHILNYPIMRSTAEFVVQTVTPAAPVSVSVEDDARSGS